MRAIIVDPSAPEGLRLAEVPEPVPDPVRWCSRCTTHR
jgi:hypothetical protein